MKLIVDFTPPYLMRRAIEKGRRDIRAAAKRGMKLAMQELVSDTLNVEPKVPIRPGPEGGSLKGSISGFVDSELVITTEAESPGPGANPERTLTEPPIPGEINGVVIVNADQAERLHEHPEYTFTTPGTGGKFLESKMVMFHDKYMKLINREIGLLFASK